MQRAAAVLPHHALNRHQTPATPQIEYDDGDEEVGLLCKESKLQLFLEPGESLPLPTRGELMGQGTALLQAAEDQEADAQRQLDAAEKAAGRRAHRVDPKLHRMLDEGGGGGMGG